MVCLDYHFGEHFSIESVHGAANTVVLEVLEEESNPSRLLLLTF